MFRFFITLLLPFIAYPVFCQKVEVRGSFLMDSALIGQDVRYALSARYPSKLNILFPDSTADFGSFEYSQKEYFTTKTIDSISYDSVIYYVKTFILANQQRLALPVFIVHESDCTVMLSSHDTIQIKSSLPAAIDTVSFDNLPLIESVDFQPMEYGANYWLISTVIGIVLVVALMIWVIFGNSVRKHFLLRRMHKNFQKFITTYQLHIERLQQSTSTEVAETTVSVWKKYMENLERLPFTKLTTKETINIVKDEVLTTNLKTIDRSIYGSHPVTKEPFEALRQFAEDKFHKKIEEVKHG